MKNILNIDNGIPTLLSNVDDGTNTLYINDELVPSSEWTGTGYYTFTSGGLTFTIRKIRDTSGNIMLQLIEQSGGTSYRLIKAVSTDDKYYSIDDPAETDLADGDYVPFYDTSAGAKKKSLWSNIVDKIKTALGIASSGNTYLKKDGTWGTPTNTTYTFATGDSNGQIKVTPSGGTAQNVSVKGLGSAAYLEADKSGTANTVVQRSGYGYVNAGNSATENPASYTAYPVFQDSDGWYRKATKANYLSWLGINTFSVWYKNYITSVLTITNSYKTIASVQITLNPGTYLIFANCLVKNTNGTTFCRAVFGGNTISNCNAHSSSTDYVNVVMIGTLTVTTATTAWLGLEATNSNGTGYIGSYHTMYLAGLKLA